MMHARSLAGFLFAALLAILLHAPNAAAKPPASCHGQDLLAELRDKDPAKYSDVMARSVAEENGQAVLWRIEKPGIRPSHLFGTLHVSDERITELPDDVDRALADAKTVVLEVDNVSTAATGRALSKSGRLLVYLDGQRLDQQLNEQEFGKARDVLARAGMPSDFALLFRPWLVSMFLSVSDCERRRLQSGHRVLEMQIAERARQRGIDVIGLETLERRMDALASVPNSEQVAMLRSGLAHLDRSNDLRETMIELYRSRRLGAAWPFQILMAQQAGAAVDDMPGYRERVVIRRNVLMRDRALPILERGDAFMAVGAFHLIGEQGLVAMLRDEGFLVTPVM